MQTDLLTQIYLERESYTYLVFTRDLRTDHSWLLMVDSTVQAMFLILVYFLDN